MSSKAIIDAVKFVADMPTPVTAMQVAAKFNISREAAWERLHRAAKLKLIYKIYHGHYCPIVENKSGTKSLDNKNLIVALENGLELARALLDSGALKKATDHLQQEWCDLMREQLYDFVVEARILIEG